MCVCKMTRVGLEFLFAGTHEVGGFAKQINVEYVHFHEGMDTQIDTKLPGAHKSKRSSPEARRRSPVPNPH